MPTNKSEIRKDYLLDERVIITPSRAKRPRDVKEEKVAKSNPNCPFCVDNLDKKNIVDKINKENSNNWGIVSINNIFPAVTLNNEKAYGKQEVIIETPNHGLDLADLSQKQIYKVLEMYSKRTKALSKNKKLDYILCFKNHGVKAGASLKHSHSQVFASAVVPKDLKEEARLAENYKIRHNSCAYCDILRKEIKTKRRVFEDKNIASFTPYASKYHYEAWIFPKRHLDNVTLLNKSELKSFAKAIKIITKKLQALNIDYNFFLHNVVSNTAQHFYVKVQPRDSVWAGVELGSGLVINSISPEVAASYYREK
ncbi:MAG: galactose-1-phosphate uridylyltransferase [Parcubacteria group bacterium]